MENLLDTCKKKMENLLDLQRDRKISIVRFRIILCNAILLLDNKEVHVPIFSRNTKI